MYKEHTVGVVVPAYNEEAFIGDVIRDIPEFVDRLYVIDDDSTDDTWEAVRIAAEKRAEGASTGESVTESGEISTSPSTDGGMTQLVSTDASTQSQTQTNGQQHRPQPASSESRYAGQLASRISVSETIGTVVRIQHDKNRGAGGAIKTGYLAAVADEMDIIATIDADGQMDSTTLSQLLDPLVEDIADYAKGNRFYDAEVLRKMPRFRLTGNLLLTGLTRVSSGYWRLRDPQNGFTAATRETLVEADIETLWTYYGYMNQLMVRFSMNDVRIADVPMETTYGDEESNIEYIPYIRKVSSLLLRMFLTRFTTSDDPATRRTAACYLSGVSGILATVYLAMGKLDTESSSRLRLVIPALISAIVLVAGTSFDRQSTPDVVRWEQDQ